MIKGVARQKGTKTNIALAPKRLDTPHCTRHTTLSLLASAGVNQTIIKRIAGHSGAMNLTEKIYIHFDIQELVDAINLI